jgi:hypothetical protein
VRHSSMSWLSCPACWRQVIMSGAVTTLRDDRGTGRQCSLPSTVVAVVVAVVVTVVNSHAAKLPAPSAKSSIASLMPPTSAAQFRSLTLCSRRSTLHENRPGTPERASWSCSVCSAVSGSVCSVYCCSISLSAASVGDPAQPAPDVSFTCNARTLGSAVARQSRENPIAASAAGVHTRSKSSKSSSCVSQS